jgi:WD40 repeat protein
MILVAGTHCMLNSYLKTLVTGGDDKCVRVWDVHSAEERTLTLREHADGIDSMDPGSDFVVSESDDRTVRLWDLSKTGKDRYVGARWSTQTR